MTPAPTVRRSLLHRASAAICPQAEREWIDALFFELDEATDTRSRRAWLLGTASIAAFAVRLRASLAVPSAIWWAIIIALHAAIVFAIGSRSDFEGFRMDDDVFLRFAWVSGVLFLGLVVLAITRIINHTDAPNRHAR